MNLPTVFNKNKKVREQNDLVTIEVPDIKQYLVNEFDRANELVSENKKLKLLLEKSEETNIKYNATLITLNEYKKRLDNSDSTIKELEEKIDIIKNEKMKVIDEKNSLVIMLNELGRTKEEIEKKLEVEHECCLKEKINFALSIIINVLMNKKGTLTKSYVKEIIEKEMIA